MKDIGAGKKGGKFFKWYNKIVNKIQKCLFKNTF